MKIECEAYELVSLIEEATNKNIYSIQEKLDEIEESLEQLLEKQSRESDSVLNKIRAEIEQKIKKSSGLNHTRSERERNDAFLEVLDIIDKYKEKSEKKEE